MGVLRSRLWFWTVFVIVAALAACLGFPLARFPFQDLLWNDLALLGRVAWAREALVTNPFASIDFLQGFGVNSRLDVKIIPHFFDPAVVFHLFAGLYSSLWLRAFVLSLYALVCLDALIAGEWAKSRSLRTNPYRVPLLVFYLFSPMFFFEVAHHFSAVFLTLPGVLWAVRYFARRPSWYSSLAFVVAATLLVQTSDLHIVFIAAAFAIFIGLFDPEFRRARMGVKVTLGTAFAIILFLSFGSALRLFVDSSEMVSSFGQAWPVSTYWESFIKPAALSLFFPVFAGPVCLYVLPYLILLVPIFFYHRQAPRLFSDLRVLFFLVLALFAFGVILHAIPPIRVRLPSVFRYHLAIVPCLLNLWIVLRMRELDAFFTSHFRVSRVKACALAFVLLGAWGLLTLRPEANTFLALQGKEISLPYWALYGVGILCITTLPFVFSGLVFWGAVPVVNRQASLLLGSALLLSVLLYVGRPLALQMHNFVYVDTSFSSEVYRHLPQAVEAIIDRSAYASYSRSFVPIAKEVFQPGSGRNDKLMPLTENPEAYGGRSFFQWRFSTSRHVAPYYEELTGLRPFCLFPPTPGSIGKVVDFAVLSESPFIVSADSELPDPRLELLGSYTIQSALLERHRGYNDGLVGTIYIYAVRNIPNKKARYSRTLAHFNFVQGVTAPTRLPLTYFSDLRAQDSAGRPVALRRGADGFAWLDAVAEVKDIWVSSYSIWSLGSLVAPLAGFVFLLLAVGWRFSFNLDTIHSGRH
jgi:hypothetical protein